jgi:hypothetical protein
MMGKDSLSLGPPQFSGAVSLRIPTLSDESSVELCGFARSYFMSQICGSRFVFIQVSSNLPYSPYRPTDRTVPPRHMSIRRLKHILGERSWCILRTRQECSFMSPRCCEDPFSSTSSRIVRTQFSSASSLRHVAAHHTIQQHERRCPRLPSSCVSTEDSLQSLQLESGCIASPRFETRVWAFISV